MHIKKLILYKYKRFLLSNIELLEYTPKNIIQMIASRNLAGKSSLLKQLNPLPADIKKDFKEDGYKIIEISHLNNDYVLTSNTKHSFICNNNELNPGGTKKVQLDLVKEHFGITPAIMDIINNINRITIMSPNERKYWFTEMSSVDYTFPIKVYKLMKQQQRDYIGGIKLIQENIIKSKLNQKSKEELERAKENKKMLEKYIDFLLSLYDRTVEVDKYKESEDEIKDSVRMIMTTLDTHKDETTYNIKELKELVIKSTTELELVKKNQERLTKELETIDSLVNLGSESDLKQSLQIYTTKSDQVMSQVNPEHLEILKSIEVETYKSIIDSYSAIYGDLIALLNELHQYDSDRLISKEDKDKIRKDYEQYSLVKIKLESLITKVTVDIEHMIKHKTEDNLLSCPKCSHSFYKGYNEESIKQFNTLLTDYKNKLVVCNKKVDELKSIVEKLNNSDKLIDQITYLISGKPEIKPFLGFILKDNSIQITNVSTILSRINQMPKTIVMMEVVYDYYKKIELIGKSLEQIALAKKANLELNKSRVEILEKDLVESNKKSSDLLTTITDTNKIINRLNTLQEYYTKLENAISKRRKDFDSSVKNYRNIYLQELIQELRKILIDIDSIVTDHNTALVTLENNNKLLEEYKVKEKVLNLASKELSPDEGLIAKSINSFISVIIEEMNQVINSIWTYDLELLPCEVSDENDLDYKFKVRVNNDHIVEDIGKLSSSGKEIVDLAFRLVFAKYIGLVDIPLYLDEFGSTFDQAHRVAAYAVIDKILSSDYGQIFIVCHFSQIYGAFKNIDFNVLDANNIDIPTNNEINEVLKLKYYA